jgi:hypothetical protein
LGRLQSLAQPWKDRAMDRSAYDRFHGSNDEDAPLPDGEGWSRTPGKWHYFTADGISLCRKWHHFIAPREAGNDDSPDNCAECRRRLAKRGQSNG